MTDVPFEKPALPKRLWIVVVQDGFERPWDGLTHWHGRETHVYQRQHAARAKAERYRRGGTSKYPRRLVSFACTDTSWVDPS